MLAKGFNSRIEVEDDLLQLSNLVSKPEAIEYSDLFLISKLIKTVTNMETSIFANISDYFSKAFFDCINSLLFSLNYEYNPQTSYSTTPIPFDLKRSDLTIIEDTILLSLKYLTRLTIKTPSSTSLEFSTNSFTSKITNLPVQSLTTTTHILKNSQNCTINFPENFLKDPSGDSQDVNLVTVWGKISPVSLYGKGTLVTEVVSVMLVDGYGGFWMMEKGDLGWGIVIGVVD